MNAAGEVPPGVDIVISKPVTQNTLRGAVGRVVQDVSTGDPKLAELTGEAAS